MCEKVYRGIPTIYIYIVFTFRIQKIERMRGCVTIQPLLLLLLLGAIVRPGKSHRPLAEFLIRLQPGSSIIIDLDVLSSLLLFFLLLFSTIDLSLHTHTHIYSSGNIYRCPAHLSVQEREACRRRRRSSSSPYCYIAMALEGGQL